jgi:hypothetical protein
MTEKNNIANALDKAFEALGKRAKNSDNDMLNMLPKPDSQSISDGVIVWRWNLDTCIVESVLATRNSNPLKLEKDTYVVNIQMPKTEECYYSLFDDTAKEIGQALMSAWNWQHIWKLHAGDFLLEILSQEPIEEPEPFVSNDCEVIEPEIVETIDVEPEAIRTTPSFDA